MKLTATHNRLIAAARGHLARRSETSWFELEACAQSAGQLPRHSRKEDAAGQVYNLRVDVLIAARLYAVNRSRDTWKALEAAVQALDDFANPPTAAAPPPPAKRRGRPPGVRIAR